MSAFDDINRVFREFRRYTGDGLPGEPVNAPLPVGDPQSGMYSPKKSEIRGGLTKALVEAVAEAAPITRATWAELAAEPGSRDGQPAEVVNDPGTHTDPVTDETVNNEGVYAWSVSPAGWQRVADTGIAVLESTKADKYNASTPGLIIALVDGNNYQTWIQARALDGGPSDLSLRALRMRLNESTVLPERWDYPGVIAAILDPNERQTWLVARAPDGAPPEWVIQHLADRLAPYIGGGGGTASITTGDRYVRDGEVLPFLPDPMRIAGWGSSSMERSASAFSAMASAFGATYYDGGDGGVRIQHSAAQMGAVPALLTVSGGSIPASGGVTVTASNMAAIASLKPFPGTLAGIHGMLSSTSTTITFTRTSSGSVTPVDPDTPFIPDAAIYRDAVVMLWVGKNNLTGVGDAQLVIDMTIQMFEWLAPMVKRCLVLGHFVNTDTPEVSTTRNEIYAVNAALAAHFKDLYVDCQSYLCDIIPGDPDQRSQAFIDLALTPDSTDIAQMTIGNLPPSLAADAAHVSTEGYQAFADNRVAPRMADLNWYKEV